MARAARPELSVGLLTWVAAAGIGGASGLRPEVALAGAGVLAAAALLRAFPALLLAGLTLVAPCQAALAALSPRLKTLDEAVVLLVSGSVLLVALIRRPQSVLRQPVVLWAAGFALLGVASAALAKASPVPSALGVFVTLDYVVLAAALLVLPLRRTAYQAVIVLLLGLGAVAVLLGIAQHIFGVAALPEHARFIWERELLRVPSLFPHPNDLAYLMLPVTFVSVAGWWLRRNLAFALFAVIGVLGMLLAVSRSSYVAVAAGLVGAVLLSGRLNRRGLGLVLGGLLFAAPLMAPGIVSRVEKVQREGGDARFRYAKKGLGIAAQSPWFGVGPGRFGGVVAQRYGSEVHERYGLRFNSTWTTVDSFWLHVLVESGGLGLLTVLGLLAVVVRDARRRLRDAADPPEQQILQLAVLMLVPAHLVINLSSMALEANSTAAVLWLLVGLALSPRGPEGPPPDREPEAEADRGVEERVVQQP